jgi:hypothetical protein
MHDYSSATVPKSELIEIDDPLSRRKIILRKNLAMIRLLKEEYSRGAYTIVWSRGGHEWATAVILALGLKSYVSQIMSKPLVYLDDKDVSLWLKDRIYIGPDTKYKHITEEL